MKKRFLALAMGLFAMYGVTVYGSESVNVGDTITFGHYEQDNDTSNGAEEIEWEVLDVQEGKALLISKYGLDAQPYHTKEEEVTWETCTLRTWLNEDFYQTAFDSTEQEKIETTTVHTEDNRKLSTSGGNDTEDNIFLMSLEELEKYYGVDAYDILSHENLKVKATEYAVANGAHVVTQVEIDEYLDLYSSSDEGYCWWWLRSPGRNDNNAADVLDDGSLFYGGDGVNIDCDCVRPALWINL